MANFHSDLNERFTHLGRFSYSRALPLALCAIVSLSVLRASDRGTNGESNQGWDYWQSEGESLLLAGNYSAAADAFQTALHTAEEKHLNPQVFAMLHDDFAAVYAEEGQFAKSEREFHQAMAIVEKTEGSQSLDYSILMARVALLPTHNDDRTDVIESLQKAIANHSANISERDLAIARDFLAKLFCSQSRYQEAEAALLDSESAIQTKGNLDLQVLAELLNDMGAIRNHQQRYREAAEAEEEALRILGKELGPENPALVVPLNNLATIYVHDGNPEQAEVTFQHSLDIAAKKLGKDHPTYAAVLLNYAALLKKMGRKREGRKMDAEARQIMDESNRHNGVGMTVSVASLRSNPN